MRKFRDSPHKRLWAISFFVCIAIVICIICNLAIEHEMTWLVYPVCSLMFGWGVFAPLIYRGMAGLKLSLGLMTSLLLPYLLVLEQWTGTGGWFVPIAFPVGVAGIAYVWVLYFIFTRGMNPWNAAALTLAAGGILSLGAYLGILLIAGYAMFPWGWLTSGSALGAALLIFAAGKIRLHPPF
ncbi:MAG: DUF6320 domain-containing protein [Methanocorpusculum sp.]|nr:DUF6320 domain-containing protein [Methanocorpusculum sp.]